MPPKEGQIHQHVPKNMWDRSQYRQKGVGYIKMSSKLCRINLQSRSRRQPVAIIHIFARFFEVQPRWHGGDRKGKE